MQERRYLLNISQMLEGEGRDDLLREALDGIDRKRRQKALSVQNVRAQAAGIGAGLLIQKALADYRTECPAVPEPGRQAGYRTALRTEQSAAYPEPPEDYGAPEGQEPPGDYGTAEEPVLECFSVEELLAVLDRKVTEPCYQYGKSGKPYLTDHPFQFNLSHSGNYVFCGVSEQEIGVDIQKIQGNQELRLAKRFFAGPERRALEACGDEERRRRMFFRMWVRKEAYGKLTGEGIAGTVGKCFWRDAPAGEEPSARSLGKGLWQEDELIWEEYDLPDGYRAAVCRFREDTAPSHG